MESVLIAWRANAEVALGVAVMGGGLLLSIVGATAWVRLRRLRMFFVTVGFLILALKGAYLAEAAWAAAGSEPWIFPMVALDTGLLLAFYGSLRAPRG